MLPLSRLSNLALPFSTMTKMFSRLPSFWILKLVKKFSSME